ncbi:MAG: 3-isopropylmalate dehydrogenase [Planctomycetaceae bacterium]|jgi:3-isopropylmalate dehydrogenase|nr:3-isopropylmalate dehydrogenase [Planctomycetaceae bacterium]
MLKIAVIGGDGTGPEVIAESIKVLKAVSKLENFTLQLDEFDINGARYVKTGTIITDEEIATLRKYRSILFGAVGRPDIAPGILERGFLLRLRFEFDQYINLRPVKLFPGVETPLKNKKPEDLDFVVVRENTEDMYAGIGGFLHKGTPSEVATQTAIFTRKGCERCIRWAFEYTRKRNNPKGKKLTLVAKTNVLTYGHDLWWRTFQDVAKEYPDVKTDYNHVDACCIYMVDSPERYDVIVTTNMFGDIITDLGAILQGGLGVAAGGNINPDEGGTSMYEPIGGSAPDFTGKNQINPIAAILSGALLLEQEGYTAAAQRIQNSVLKVVQKMKSQAAAKMGFSTTEVGGLVCENL